ATEIVVLPPGGGSWGISTQADLGVSDLFPNQWPQGAIIVRIVNNGPDPLTNMPNNQLACSAVIHPYNGAAVYSTSSNSPINLDLGVGQNATFNSGITVDGTTAWYQITCSIQANFPDPNSANNSYSESFPPPP
ncbi:MAG: hypothetical protein ACPL4H_11700, partial [Anaerolineales bacterium]